MYDFIEKIAENLLVYGFQVEGERAEAIIAADHGAHGVFHPAVSKQSPKIVFRQNFNLSRLFWSQKEFQSDQGCREQLPGY
ncbi:MAG: hypothetical protein J6Y60_13210 [Treponema sp.]|nr:hypothetical protein [Treponema sp.]